MQLKKPFLEESCWSLASLEEVTQDLSKSTEASLDQIEPQQAIEETFLEESC